MKYHLTRLRLFLLLKLVAEYEKMSEIMDTVDSVVLKNLALDDVFNIEASHMRKVYTKMLALDSGSETDLTDGVIKTPSVCRAVGSSACGEVLVQKVSFVRH